MNAGDVFQDIYPSRSMANTQSQKAIGPINFHKDLANHFVRPDFVNMISLRASADNSIFTTFVKNIDLLDALTAEEKTGLAKVQFHTPFDDLTTKEANSDVGESKDHSVIGEGYDLRFFEGRTIGLNAEAKVLVERLERLLHEKKSRVQMMPGDFIGVQNNFSLHGKEIESIQDEPATWSRYMMKTVNVSSIDQHKHYLVPGSSYLVAG